MRNHISEWCSQFGLTLSQQLSNGSHDPPATCSDVNCRPLRRRFATVSVLAGLSRVGPLSPSPSSEKAASAAAWIEGACVLGRTEQFAQA